MLSNENSTTRATAAVTTDQAVVPATPAVHSDKLAQTNRRVLLIAFHFPPEAISSGIQRTLSFFKHLGKYGWEPMVLSAHPRVYRQQNPSQLASLPASQVVRRAFALDTKYHMGIKGRYLELLALPDRWVSWFFGAVPAGLSLIRQHRPQVIWSTFPIATAHLIGLALHRLTGLPWIADFRDPMLQPAYPTAKLQRKVYQWIEAETVKRCTFAVLTTHSAMSTYRTRFPELASKFTVIENGYDEDGLAASAPTARAAAPADEERITLLHSGVLYQTGRNPSAFMKAVAMLKEEGAVSAATLRVILRAPGEAEAMLELAQQHGVDDIVEIAPSVPYREALREMLSVDGLMVFQGTPFNTQIPAKLYEYFWARRPILGLVDPTGETARVMGAAGFESVAHMDRPESIVPVLKAFIEQIRSGSVHVASDEVVKQCSRANRAQQLAHLLDAAISTSKVKAA
ncbi:MULTISPECIES: glycosyltransferase [unclassified Massilia]|uniref:glycosyltransferase n=1 Tax=unclassified Massilia TaxID=2609279 RepID=UPI000A4E9ACB|nr:MULTISPECIES: glycosyltransferase [unclassified Massilia]